MQRHGFTSKALSPECTWRCVRCLQVQSRVSVRQYSTRPSTEQKSRGKEKGPNNDHTSPQDRPLHFRRPSFLKGRSLPPKDGRYASRYSRNDHGDSRNLKLDSAKSPLERSQTTGMPRFQQIIKAELNSLVNQINKSTFRSQMGIVSRKEEDMFRLWQGNLRLTVEGWKSSEKDLQRDRFEDWLQRRLWKYFVSGGKNAVGHQLRYIFQDSMANTKYGAAEIVRQAKCADLRFPAEWYPKARKMDREIHLHIGPTNSGKTYHALQRLQKAKRGIYGGPLRLLAHEVHGRMINAGRSCNMITGDERIISEDPDCGLISSTVEMIPQGMDYDVAVIDEIQMIANSERGSAWTEAFLGIRAKELHLCGETRALPLIRQLAISTGDKLIVHEYKRLSPLAVAGGSLSNNLHNIRSGDCLVAFSRAQIHEYRHSIAKATGRNVAVVYGSLPPETRAEQARLFNDPNSGYDVLVASNAVGMGLNLSIKRIIFATVTKFNGEKFETLLTSDVKQIGGRAGRYRSSGDAFGKSQIVAAQQVLEGSTRDLDAPEAVASSHGADRVSSRTVKTTAEEKSGGIVTTLRAEDLPYIAQHMDEEPEPITKAALALPDDLVVRFASYFSPETPLTYILLRLREIARLSPHYSLERNQDDVMVADGLAVVPNLPIRERLVFCGAPVNMENPTLRALIVAMARCVADCRPADFFKLPIPIDVLNSTQNDSIHVLRELEDLHSCLTLYMWLSFRYVGIFTSQAVAQHARDLTEQRISQTLSSLAQAGVIGHKERQKMPPSVSKLAAAVRARRNDTSHLDSLLSEVRGSGSGPDFGRTTRRHQSSEHEQGQEPLGIDAAVETTESSSARKAAVGGPGLHQ